MTNMSEDNLAATLPSDVISRSLIERRFLIDAYHIALLLLMILAWALRLFHLDAQSVWWDEGISLHLASSELSEIASDRLNNIHPPLYFVILKGWLSLTGISIFAARYLSVLAGWLQVSATYGVATRWFGRRTGLASAILTTVSAVLVIYAQETRVYAILPLLYLALLALTRELTHANQRDSSDMWPAWISLAVVSWIAIHLHYMSLFAVAYVTVWALYSFMRAGRWSDCWRLVAAQSLAAVASLPWFTAAITNLPAIRGEANAGTFVTDPVPVRFLIGQVWTFYLTGLAGSSARQGITMLAISSAIIFLLLVLFRLSDKQTRQNTIALLAHWIIPLSSALIVWKVRSFSHPRYVVMLVPGLILLASYIIVPGTTLDLPKPLRIISQILSTGLALCLIAVFLRGLSLYYFDDDVAKDNIRGAARYLEQEASERDVILVPDTDWSLPFEYRGFAQVGMPELQFSDDIWHNLDSLTNGISRVFTLDYQRGTRDWQGIVPFSLHKAGTQTDEVEIDQVIIRTFTLDQDITPPEDEPMSAQFGPLQLTGAWIEQGAPAGDVIPIALKWRMSANGTKQRPRANVSIRLVDDNYRIVSTKDDRLLDAEGKPTDLWANMRDVTTYHLLPLPPATPPVSYTIAIQIYVQTPDGLQPMDILDDQGAPQGQTYYITGIRTDRQARSTGIIDLDSLYSSYPQAIDVAPNLILLDSNTPQNTVEPGTPLFVELLWMATDHLPDIRPKLELIQGETTIIANNDAPAGGLYGTNLWMPGEQVREERELMIPPESAGEATLYLEFKDQKLQLGTIEIVPGSHQFDAPPVKWQIGEQFGDLALLVGFNLPERQYSTAEAVPLQLIWQSLQNGSDQEYIVFTHLLTEDGRLIGQHDGVPDQGDRPVQGWLEGEYIVDDHDIVFRDSTYNGTAYVEVGFYDPISGDRLPLADGSDRLLLTTKLEIAETP